MKTLQYLNGIASTTVNYTDNRPSGVIFDRPQGKGYSFTETTLSFPLLVGANIIEIINPLITNVRYKINLGSVDASLSYAGLPGGVTVSQSGTIFTYFGIDSVIDWEAIKQPNIVIDPSFQGTFSYEASIVYNTDTTADNEFTWTVGIYVPISEMQSETQINIIPKYFRGIFTNMQSVATLFVEGTDVLPMQFIFTTNAVKNAVSSPALSSSTTIFAKPRQFTFADSTVTINNPEPYENGNFGQNLVVDSDYITTVHLTSTPPVYQYKMRVFDIQTGNLVQTITDVGSDIVGNNNWILNRSINASGEGVFKLYKRQLTGDPYSLVDTVITPYSAQGSSYTLSIWNGITENYLAIRNTASGTPGPGKNNYITDIYSIDEINGFTLLYSKQGTAYQYLANTFEQRLGEKTAISDSYLCLAENVQIGAAPGTHDDIFVYETATGNSLFTISNNDEVRDMLIEDNFLYVLTSAGIFKWNLSTNSQVFSYGFTGNYRLQRYGEKWVAVSTNTGPATSIGLINEQVGSIESGITITHSDFRFADINTLVVGNSGYDGVAVNQGIIYIKKET